MWRGVAGEQCGCQRDSLVCAGLPQPRLAWSQEGSASLLPPGPAALAKQNTHQASVSSASQPRSCTPAPDQRYPHPTPPPAIPFSAFLPPPATRLLPSGPPLSLLQAVLPVTSTFPLGPHQPPRPPRCKPRPPPQAPCHPSRKNQA